MQPLIVIVTDSVTNSVFAGQVLTPLIVSAQEGNYSAIHILSCEQAHVPQEAIKDIRGLLAPQCHIRARGAFAGYIAIHGGLEVDTITIQARGLLAEEF